jgi:cell division protein FtsB
MAQGRLLASVRRRARIRRLRRFLFWGGALFLTYVFIAGPFGFIQYQKLKARQQSLLMQSRQLTAEVCDLEQEIRRLQYDTLYIERVARERFGFARPTERVYKITPQ